jgi:DNA repair exonuclease SbcCD ATPase subunit
MRSLATSLEHAALQARELPDEKAWAAHAEKLTAQVEDTRSLISELNSLIDDASTPAPAKPVVGESEARTTEEDCSRSLSILDRSREAFEVKADWSALPKSIRDSSQEDFQVKQSAFMLALSSRHILEAEVSKAEQTAEDLETVRGKLRPLKLKLADRAALELLENAFSAKGVESDIIRSICEKLQQQVNKYAKLIFPEDYHFEFELETQFSITVRRKYGKATYSSDVRKLSGAERKLFSLVLLVSLLSFVPKSRRTSLLILDEPTAAMGPENVANFIRFLPVLQKIIPTIVVITPLDPSHYSSIQPEVFTVVKERNGTAKIVKGQA